MAAVMLFLSYLIGLWFTLRTHAAVIWNTEIEEKKHEDAQVPPRPHPTPMQTAETTGVDIRDSHLYKRILGQSLRQVSLGQTDPTSPLVNGGTQTPHILPLRGDGSDNLRSSFPGLSNAENQSLVQGMTEIAATAAAIAARDVRSNAHTRRPSAQGSAPTQRPTAHRTSTLPDQEEAPAPAPDQGGHGAHDAPNWSRLKSSIILLGATVLYAIIAEILVDTVDVVLEGFAIDEKFLGITLFALVPNTTEFLNAISFAMNGNIALSMEIGSAYALQVCLLQIPALVLYTAVSAVPNVPDNDYSHYTFSLLFPQWDMVTVILCVFLLSHMYGEGKSNYFKGSILLLSYLVVVAGYYFSGYTNAGEMAIGMSRFDRLGPDGQFRSYNTIGRGRSGIAYAV